MSMMAKTVSGFDPFVCCSSVQKAVRRSDERLGVQFALEMAYSSKAYFTMIVNRLRVMIHEDIGPADPMMTIMARLALTDARAMYDEDKGDWVLAITNCVLCMCRARKSRVALNLYSVAKNDVERQRHAVPDCAKDIHTVEGKRQGRGSDHFFDEGQVLIDPSEDDPRRFMNGQSKPPVIDYDLTDTGDDPYAKESRTVWQTGGTKYGNGTDKSPRSLKDKPSEMGQHQTKGPATPGFPVKGGPALPAKKPDQEVPNMFSDATPE